MSASIQKFNESLQTWFQTNKRDFPWRHTHDPYKIWISEVMSQQTQISRVANGFYPRFLEQFPDVQSLAQSEWDDVFPVWDGLGYYSRGKNILKSAKIISQNEGIFPDTVEALEKLPGIGKYTASAICAFAHQSSIAAVDTNIRRIISALWPDQDIQELAQKMVENSSLGWEWNAAMMDLSDAIRRNIILAPPIGDFFPPEKLLVLRPGRKKSKKKTKKTEKKNDINRIEVGIACIHQDGKYLIQSRPKGKSFAGWWEFPGGKREAAESFRDCVKREIEEEIGIKVSVRPHFIETIHEFENTTLILRFHRCQIQAGAPTAKEKQTIKWVSITDFKNIKFLKTNAEAVKRLSRMRI